MQVKNNNSNQVKSGYIDFGEVCLHNGRYLIAIDIDKENVLEINYSMTEEIIDPDFYVDLESGVVTVLESSCHVTPCPKAFLGFES